MIEVIGIKYEETGSISYVLPDQTYQKDDFLVVQNRKGSRLAQVVQANFAMSANKLPDIDPGDGRRRRGSYPP